MTEPTPAEVADLLFRASRELRAARRSKLAAECQSLAGRLQHAAAPSSAVYGTCHDEPCVSCGVIVPMLQQLTAEGLAPLCRECYVAAANRQASSAAYQPPAERLAAMDAGGAR